MQCIFIRLYRHLLFHFKFLFKNSNGFQVKKSILLLLKTRKKPGFYSCNINLINQNTKNVKQLITYQMLNTGIKMKNKKEVLNTRFYKIELLFYIFNVCR